MLNVDIELLGLKFKMSLTVIKEEEEEVKSDDTYSEEHSLFFDEQKNEDYDKNISNVSEIFKHDLKSQGTLYDIPNPSDIAPNYHIQNDVEIMTDKFEKEVEDTIEGRR